MWLRVCCLLATDLWIFQLYFCYWFLTSSLCGQEKHFISYICLFKSLETWLMSWHKVCLGKHPVCTWGECSCCGGVGPSARSDPAPLLCWVLPSSPPLRALLVGLGVQVSSCSVAVSVPSSLRVSLPIFRWFITWCVNIHNGCIFI